MEHRDDALLHSPVGTLSHSILLRPGSDRVLPLDAMLCTEVIHVPAHVLTTLVLPKNLDGVTSLVLSPSLKPLEAVKGLRLLLHGEGNSESARVINEGDPVDEARVGGNPDRAMDIRVNEAKEFG